MHQAGRVLRPLRLGVAGAAVMIAVCVMAMILTGGSPAGVSGSSAVGAIDSTALASQKCVLCGRAFAEKLAQLCGSCDRGKCFKCGGAFPDNVARLCSSCHKNKCINCGRAFPDRAAKLCDRCNR